MNITLKTLIEAGVPTINGRTYSREDLSYICNLPIPEVGVLYKYEYDINHINLMDVSHKNLKLYLNEEDILVCDILILDTPKGKILKQIVNELGVDVLFINICFLVNKDIITGIHSLCVEYII